VAQIAWIRREMQIQNLSQSVLVTLVILVIGHITRVGLSCLWVGVGEELQVLLREVRLLERCRGLEAPILWLRVVKW
jgi:hypothetical protein